MARPRTMTWPRGGRIEFHNMLSEDVTKIKEMLSAGVVVVEDSEEPTEKETGVAVELDMNRTAIGTFKDSDGWKIAKLKYNEHTGQAKLDSVKYAGPGRYEASDAFKIASVDEDFI